MGSGKGTPQTVTLLCPTAFFNQYTLISSVYLDLKNVIDTAFEDGIAEGIAKGRAAGK